MKLFDDIPVWGEPVDEGALGQIRAARQHAFAAAMMADHHLGYGVPIGGVVAYQEHVSPTGVGYDIGCGNKAVRLDADPKDVRRKIHKIMDDVARKISFGVGRSNAEDVDHELFDDPLWSFPVLAKIKDKARDQLGTVGGGNHYVDVFVDEQERIWVGVHFGSRGLGHTIASHFIHEGEREGLAPNGIVSLHERSALGEDYIQCMQLALRYAYAGRDWVCARVARILRAAIEEEVHNNHNDAQKETHFGEALWIVRKGATPAFPGQRGFVGASMGERSVIIEGVESEASRMALYSTVHGAGRTMSRTRASGKNRGGKRVSDPAVTEEMMQAWVRKSQVVLRGGEVDESPHCYKRLDEVLAHHADSVRVLHTLTPLGVAMAGAGTFDPYQD